MKKILALFDVAEPPEPILNFIRNLYIVQEFSLKIVFYGFPEPGYSVSDAETNIKRFETFCNDRHFSCKIHKDFKSNAELWYEESRYADLLLLSNITWNDSADYQYVDLLIHNSECPVLLLPAHYNGHDRNIVAYDGSAASIYALKQFVQVFPELLDLDTLIAYADDGHKDIPGLPFLKEYAQQHFSSLAYYVVTAGTPQNFSAWVEGKGNTMIVSGAKGRSALSEFFRKSFMDELIKNNQVAVFIAHP